LRFLRISMTHLEFSGLGTCVCILAELAA